MSMVNIEALCFILLLLTASIYDLRTHQIPNTLSLIIAILGFLHNSPFTALIGLFIIGLPFLLAAIFSGGKIGGGDIKLMAACGVVLGPIYGTLQSILGLTLVLLFALGASFRHGFRSTSQMSFPLAPFLAVGGIAAYILSH